MVTAQTKIGALIRRGAEAIPPETMRFLVENESRVEEICAEIDRRATVFRDLAKNTEAGSIALEKARAVVAEREAVLAEAQAALEADRRAAVAAAARYSTNMDALGRRTTEVMEREDAADERDSALDDREATINRRRAEFIALTERLKTLSLETLED